MRWKLLRVAACWVVLAAAGLGADPAEQGDEVRIRGRWLLVGKTEKGVSSKVEAPKDDNLPLLVTFEEQTWKTKIGASGSPIEVSGGYTIDAQQTPKLLDFSIRGDKDSTEIHAIYKLDGDRLDVRLPATGGQRPPDFDVPADDSVSLEFQRQKDE